MRKLICLLVFASVLVSCKKDYPLPPCHSGNSDSCLNENFFYGNDLNPWPGDVEITGNIYTEAEGREVSKTNFLFKELSSVLLRNMITPIDPYASVWQPVNRLNEYFRAIGFKVTGYTPADSLTLSYGKDIHEWLNTHCEESITHY